MKPQLFLFAAIFVITVTSQGSVEVNPTHFNQEYFEFQVKNGAVDTAVTLCFRALFKHAAKPVAVAAGQYVFM